MGVDLENVKNGKATKKGGPDFSVLILAAKIAGYFALVVVFATLLSWSAPSPESPSVRNMVDNLMSLQNFFTSIIRDSFPRIAGGKYEAGVYLIILLVAFKLFVTDSLQIMLKHRMEQGNVKDEFAEYKARMGGGGSTERGRQFGGGSSKLDGADADKKSRAELLRLFAETKKRLDSMIKDVAFLSVDVVGSTAMKEGENKSLVQATFNEYKLFVQQKMTVNKALKSAWTPDGVMICFSTADDATKCAKDILNGMTEFNTTKKSIKGEFKVRCGVSAGKVHYDESTPMEEMSDRTIDVAGHMQKYAPHNGIFVPKQTYEKMRTAREGFVPEPEGKVIDDFPVYVWMKKG